MKNFYDISDFYNFIRKDDQTPSSHRHFQVYFYPIVPAADPNILPIFIPLFFTEVNLQKLTLCIQAITFPTDFNTGQLFNVTTPLGKWQSTNQTFYDLGGGSEHKITLTLLDQIQPIFEKFFNKWIKLSLDKQLSKFFKINMAIKYFKQNEMHKSSIAPNFIYYFRGVFPTSFSPCTIMHQPDSESGEDIKRKVVLSYDTCWPLSDQQYAETHYGLGYLFNPMELTGKKSKQQSFDEQFKKETEKYKEKTTTQQVQQQSPSVQQQQGSSVAKQKE